MVAWSSSGTVEVEGSVCADRPHRRETDLPHASAEEEEEEEDVDMCCSSAA